ncbi:MAG: nitroreductase family protein [Bacteroidales bacterium]|nr:nitroreductase family protein [Bacteroidales bacterium]
MTFLELTRKRYSVRSFSEKAVEPEKLDYLLECARMAPSAVNYQPWCCIVVKDKEACGKLHTCYTREWFNAAPLYLIICGDHQAAWKRGSDGKDHSDVDVAIFTEHIALAAAEQGLGCCWVCNFDVLKCRELFSIPENWEPVVILPLGYPSESAAKMPPVKKRKEMFELVKWNSFK